jgi:ring-1,2-phenylacetyl-CoA epoxidase subunit PaaC
VTIVRNFFHSAFMLLQWEALQSCGDAQLAGIAGKSLKEVAYHFRHSRDWLIRLGDGTAESHQRTQAALTLLLPYTAEFWADADPAMRAQWDKLVNNALKEAGLTRPPAVHAALPQGKNGRHSEHLAPLLAEMQSLARAHPRALW